jgi:hypothetical protein
MEKISSILPTNSRVKNVDIDDSHPIRPGTTSFGRPEGSTSSEREKIRMKAHDRVNFSDQAMQAADAEAPANKAAAPLGGKEEVGSRIADQVSRGFSDTTVRKPMQESAAAVLIADQDRDHEAAPSPALRNSLPNPVESVRSVDKYA